MLGRLIRRNSAGTSEFFAPVRRVANDAGQAVAARVGAEESPLTGGAIERPPVALALVAPVAPVEPISRLEDLGEIANFRAEVTGVVSKTGQGKCLVLDLGFNSVAIVAISEFSGTGHYNTLRQALSARSLTVVHERIVSVGLLTQLAEAAAQQRRSHIHSTDDMRNKSLYSELIDGAHRLGATDVHIVYREGEQSASDVRLRIYGRMVDWMQLPSEQIKGALAAGYESMSVQGTNSSSAWSASMPCSTITEHQVPDATGKRRGVSGRFTSRPTVDGGSKVSIRLLDTDVKDVRIPTLHELGYAESHIRDQLDPALRKNQGCILIAGGTGSGKSTTLRTFMDRLPDKERLERYSVEDPVEYMLPGVIQLSIQRTSDASEESTRMLFTAALRDLMRMDPDAIMIGEIRDAETARLATEMVNTGHRVLSTVHGNGAIDVLDRLTGKTLDVASETLASNSYLLACLYQRLLPLLCPTCKQPAHGHLTEEQLRGVTRFGLDAGTLYVARPSGCEECRLPGIAATGTRGLTVVAEVVTPDAELLAHIRDRNWRGARAAWCARRRTGYADSDMTGKTAFEHALFKMASGLIDINDIERDFEPLLTYEMHGGTHA